MDESRFSESQHTSTPNKKQEDNAKNPPLFTRREILKMGLQAVAAIGASALLGEVGGEMLGKAVRKNFYAELDEFNFEEKLKIEEFMKPKMIHGVEVYGVNDVISTPKQVEALYSHFNSKFASEHNIKSGGNKSEIRKEFLNPEERYLEVVVRRSAYDNFLAREDETKVCFEEWIKMHVDSMNICFENAKPPSKMKAVLRRIVVIDDDLPNSFWDEKEFLKGKGDNLDVPWRYEFKRPVDLDCSWAIPYDYRPPVDGVFHGTFFWKCSSNEDGTKVKYTKDDEFEVMTYSNDKESLRKTDEVWLDFGLTHEWIHYLFNLPDEYSADYHNNDGKLLSFNDFIVGTGSFHMPWVSPYLSYLSLNHVAKKLRDCDLEGYGKSYSFKDGPSEGISLNVIENSKEGVGCSVTIPDIDRDGKRHFVDKPPTCSVLSGTLSVETSALSSDPHTVLLNTSSGKSIFIPSMFFAMSKYAGLEKAKYKIEFTGDGGEATNDEQVVVLCDESDVEKKLAYYTDKAKHPYAYMKIDGTNAWAFWFIL